MRRSAAILWTLLVGAMALHQGVFWLDAKVDTDVLALLPHSEESAGIDLATRALADGASREVVVLVGAPQWDEAVRASDIVREVLTQEGLTPANEALDVLEAGLSLYRPYRDRLLTPEQAEALERAEPEDLGASAVLRLMQPGGAGLTDWNEDPLGLWPAWWSARAAESPAQPRDGHLALSGEGREWVLTVHRSGTSAFALGEEQAISAALGRARQELQQQVPTASLVAAGAPLYAEAAARQASWEISTIGTGSLLAVLLLMWLTFRSLRPLLLVGLSLLIGAGMAASVTLLVFGRVHLLTLVFGATLIGVAEDYGFHYFAARAGHPPERRHPILRALLPGMALALVTSVVAYLAMGLAPFPGLRQMAVFSVSGLTGAFLTVACWFPFLDRGALPITRFSERFAASLARWPRLRATPTTLGVGAVLVVLTGLGLLRLESRDDLRQLVSAPPALVEDQQLLGRLLALPSPSQFFLVSGESAEQTLVREEALTQRLHAAVARGELTGFRAVSDWIPSAAQQRRHAALSARAETQALEGVAHAVGEAPARAEFASGSLAPEQVLESPLGATLQPQWVQAPDGGQLSLVLLRGLDHPDQLPALAALAEGLEGVRWVDRTAEISGVLGRYRVLMGLLVVFGYGVVLVTLWLRFGASAWRAWLPSVLGTLITLGLFGWMGAPLQLFTVLGLMVLLGMGVDYGIFLLEHPGDGSAWLAVALAGVSTLLSFGLLALSSTPALSSFGLTLLVGEVTIWFLTPLFRIAAPAESPS